MLITPDQIRAARALKNWSQTDLAERTNLAVPTIANIEAGKQEPSARTLDKIVAAFDRDGIEFTGGEGVRKRQGEVTVFTGTDGFKNFMHDIDTTAANNKGAEFLISNINEEEFIKWEGGRMLGSHTKAILDNKVTYKIIIAEGDTFTPAEEYAEYRWAPKEQFYSVPLYIYGDKVGIIGVEDNDVNVFVIQHPHIAILCRRQFYEMWDRTLKMPKTTKKAGK